MRSPSLGIVTIGQSPRVDLTPDLATLLPGVHLIEEGALDGLANATIHSCLAPRGADPRLVTRLRDGSTVELHEPSAIPLLEKAIARVEGAGASATMVACTDRFPTLRHRLPLYYPDDLLQALLPVLLATCRRVAVLCPSPEQRGHVADKADAYLAATPIVVPFNPYTATIEGLDRLAIQLAALGVDAVVGDCIGYSEAMAHQLRTRLGVPVLVARTVAATALRPLLLTPRQE